jgi:hypothetical protein
MAAMLAACSSVSTRHDPAVDLTRVHRFYVERRLGDDHHLDELIVQELQHLGREASSGPLTMKPDGIDAVVTYTDRWEWDFKTYLIELNMEVRDGHSDKLLTTGHFYQPSMTTKSPPAMIREILEPLFGPRAKPPKS